MYLWVDSVPCIVMLAKIPLLLECEKFTAKLNSHKSLFFVPILYYVYSNVQYSFTACGLPIIYPIGQAQEVFEKQVVDFMKDVVNTGAFSIELVVLSFDLCVVDNPHYMWAFVSFSPLLCSGSVTDERCQGCGVYWPT